MPAPEAPTALKEMFNAARYRWFAAQLSDLSPGFDSKRFLHLTLPGLAERSLLQRLRRTSEALHATLPSDYLRALDILRSLAPRFDHNFISLVLPDFVGLYGHDHFEESMDALAYFTRFGSSEFAIREFLKRDLPRTLAVMERWAHDDNEHVRRLASEGSRPRLPWSFRLSALIEKPALAAPILEALKADPSLYVRKSVANHLNDISKDHPEWLLDWLGRWDLTNPHTAWIAKRAARSLIKAGHPRSFRLFGFTEKLAATISYLRITPKRVTLGERVEFSFSVVSTSARPQRVVVDYAIHYVKKSGNTSAKVFKLAELTLAPRTNAGLRKSQRIQDFTTRKHHPGLHRIDILLNGRVAASGEFTLVGVRYGVRRIDAALDRLARQPASPSD